MLRHIQQKVTCLLRGGMTCHHLCLHMLKAARQFVILPTFLSGYTHSHSVRGDAPRPSLGHSQSSRSHQKTHHSLHWRHLPYQCAQELSAYTTRSTSKEPNTRCAFPEDQEKLITYLFTYVFTQTRCKAERDDRRGAKERITNVEKRQKARGRGREEAE